MEAAEAMITVKKWKLNSLAAIIVMVGSGCSLLEPVAPEKLVERRALQYWNARIEGRLDKAYLFTAPSYRAVHNLDLYKSRFGGATGVKSVDPVRVTCEPMRCTVSLKLSSNLKLPMVDLSDLVSYYEETWLLEDGVWWRYEEL
jgi:hypothetical protein